MNAHRPLHRLLERARVYDLLQHLLGSDNARRRLVAEQMRPRPGDRILDIGCGTGSILEFLPASVDYVGFDPNLDYITAARARFGDRGTFLVAGVGQDLPLEAVGEVDVALALGLLHHLTDSEVLALLDTACAVLRPGGRLLTVDCAFHDGQGFLARRIISLDRGRHVRHIEGYTDLIASRMQQVRPRLVTDLLRIPYSHLIVEATRT